MNLGRFTGLLLATVSSIAVANAKPIIPVAPPQSDSQTVATTENPENIQKNLANKNEKNNKNNKKVIVSDGFKFTEKELWQINGKMPPKIVLQFLENPTPENAKRYLAWAKVRAKMIDRATAVLEQVQKEQIKKKVNTKNVSNTDIVVYFSPKCPHCINELMTLKKIKQDYPQVGLVLIPVADEYIAKIKAEKMGLGKYLVKPKSLPPINGVPYILLVDKFTGRVKARFKGETSYETLLENM